MIRFAESSLQRLSSMLNKYINRLETSSQW
jgi:hypothetical protein